MRDSPDDRTPGDVAPDSPIPATPSDPAVRVFLNELKRRGVYQVAAAYAVAASLVVQLGPTLFDAFGLPPSATRIVILLTVAGFPLAVVLAWLFELTGGVHREASLTGPAAVRAARLARLALVGVVLLAGVSAVAVLTRPRAPVTAGSVASLRMHPAGEPAARIAILYFDDLSPGGARDSLATLLTENLVGKLKGAAPSLSIVSADAVRPFRGSKVPPDSIARALDVATLVVGSVVRSAGRVRVQVALVSGANGEVIDNTVIERPEQEMLALADDVVGETSLYLRRRLGATVKLQEWRATTSSQRAWEYVREAQRKRFQAEELMAAGEADAAEAVAARQDSLLHAAERADPRWSVPTVQRGWLQVTSAVAFVRGPRVSACLLRAIDLSTRALARSPTDAAALELRGAARRYLWLLDRPHDPPAAADLLQAAEHDLLHALELDPRRAAAWSALSAIRIQKGDLAGAESAAGRAFEEDAFAGDAGEVLWRAFSSAFQLGRDEHARRWCDELTRRNPGEVIGLLCALTLEAWTSGKPDVEGAWARVRRVAESATNPEMESLPLAQIAMAGVLARAGLPDSARALLARVPLGRQELLVPEAEARVLLQEDTRARDLLRRYLAVHPGDSASFARDRRFRRLFSGA